MPNRDRARGRTEAGSGRVRILTRRVQRRIIERESRKESMMNAMTEMPAPLVFTDSAAAKVK